MIFLDKPKDFNPKIEVVSCLMEYDGVILFLQRNDDKFKGGKWCRPAGKLNAGENKLQALVREINEETGLEVKESNLEFLKTIYVRYPEFDYPYHTYKLSLRVKPDVKLNNNEHQKYIWLKPEEILNLDLLPDEADCLKLIYNL
ncbi:NUDIX domain-containing protein [Patescibacteria group bacterium]|nr:NUDIX domain-containing protein [Patescibacteria group bacterium]